MFEDATVGVVVPAYNEEGFVGEVIDTVPEFVDRIYAVDDCSTDATWREIRAHARRHPRVASGVELARLADGGPEPRSRVVALRHHRNRGVGAAIKTGYRRARRDGMDVVAVMNGDGQMDPDELERLVAPVARGEADYAKGDRLATADHREGMPAFRLFGNRLLSMLTKVASGYWGLRDPQNGYTAISGDAIDALDLDDVYDRYGFLNDLLVSLNVARMDVVDVPMRAVYGDETSGICYSSFVPSLSILLLRGFLGRLTAKYVSPGLHPLGVVYGTGIASFVAALANVGRALVRSTGRGLSRAIGYGAFGSVLFALAAAWELLAESTDRRGEGDPPADDGADARHNGDAERREAEPGRPP